MNIHNLTLDAKSPQLDSIYTAAALLALSKKAFTIHIFSSVLAEKGTTFEKMSRPTTADQLDVNHIGRWRTTSRGLAVKSPLHEG